MRKTCENCGNAKFNVDEKDFKCQLPPEEGGKCFTMNGGKWIRREKFKGIINTEILVTELVALIYRQGKAKFFNILESQIEGQRLIACKRIAEDTLSSICKNAGNMVNDLLGDWEIEATAGGKTSPEDAMEAEKEFQKAQDILNLK